MADIERSVEIEQIDYNVDINNVSYSIDILPQNTYTIELDKQGPQGLRGYTGNGIESYELTSTSGLVDTYTITFTDGYTTTVDVTNGRGITSITGPVSVGNIDTYTINYNDSTTSTFTVTNGIDGINPTVTVGTTTTGNPGTNASVINSGTTQDIILDFTIPRGDTGATGSAATIAVGTVTTGAAGSSATVTNVGTSGAAIFDFTIPRGDTGATGTSVTGVTLESTVGLQKTYRMSFSDGNHFDYVVTDGAAGATTWGGITGTLSNQTDLQDALDGKQATLVSGTNIKTINNTTLLGSGNFKLVDLGSNQNITGEKTFVGAKRIKFKQSGNNDKLGFTLLQQNGTTEVGVLEYNPSSKIDNIPIMTLANPSSTSNTTTYVGFRNYTPNCYYNIVIPTIQDAKTPLNLGSGKNFYFMLGVTDGNTTITTPKTGLLDISSFGYIKSITSSDVTTALGYTPYSDANPNGYTSNTGTVTSVNNVTPVGGDVTLTASDVGALPDSTSIPVLYSTTGNNTDGAMTQGATTTQLANKLNKQQITNCILEAPNGVYSVSGRTLTIKAGLKVLIPNGRNADGTLKNIEYTLPNDATFDRSSYSNGQYRIALLYDDGSEGDAETKSLLYVKDTLPQTVSTTYIHYCYNESTNLWYITSGSTTANWSVVKAVPLLTFFTETNNLTITDSKTPVQLVDTDMIDGQWVESSTTLASGVTYPKTTDINYSLATYLPNDNYNYEVMLTAVLSTGSVSGNNVNGNIHTDLMPNSVIRLGYIVTRTASAVYTSNTVRVPVGTNRKITIIAVSNSTGTFSLSAIGYRRIGTNI